MIDSHCHLDYLDKPIEQVKAEANALGVNRFLTIAVEEEHWQTLLGFGEAEDVDVALGIHPCDVAKAKKGWESRLLEAAKQTSVVALGETGLDYYHDATLKERQIASFHSHIEIARQLKKPIVVHMRDAKEDVLSIIRSSGVKGIMHCFSEDYETAVQAIDAGFLISFSGIVTFKNAKALQAVAQKVPLDSMLIETDAPFLTPHPFRGKKNYPGNVYYVAKAIAELKNISLETVVEQTTQNYLSLIA
jgi:TatD DNase family protein